MLLSKIFLNKQNNKTGFTLIEVLIAASILTIATGIALLSYLNSTRYQENIRKKTLAWEIAQQEAENLRYLQQVSFSTLLNLANHYGGYSYTFKSKDNNGNPVTGANAITSTRPSNLFNKYKLIPTTFNPNGLKGSVIVYLKPVQGSNGLLLNARIVVCWQDIPKVIGEDKNLNGRLDPGEDTNKMAHSHVGEIDSPVEIETAVVNTGL